MHWLLTIDRRILYALVAVALIVPMFLPFYPPIKSSRTTDGIYDAIEGVPARSPVLVSMDFDPASQAELDPMTRATLRHMFRRDLRITGMTHWPRGRDHVRKLLEDAAHEFDDVSVEVVRTFDGKAEAEAYIKNVGNKKETLREQAVGPIGRVNAGRAEAEGPVKYAPALNELIGRGGVGLVPEAVEQDAKYLVLRIRERKENKVYGRDYCYLGVRAGGSILIMSIGQSLFEAFPSDSRGNPTRQLTAAGKVLEGVTKLSSFKYLLCIAAGSSAEWWIVYGAERYGVKMGVGCTSVMAPDLYPFWPKQITGILGGAQGAWEYEAKVGVPESATKRLLPGLTAAHLLVIVFILFCNIAHLTAGRQAAAGRS